MNDDVKKVVTGTATVVEVVRRMHSEYAQTGLYNSNDLQRVLGNPKNGVGLTSPAYPSPGNNKQKSHC